MRLTCPECGAAINAGQINIHDQMAVCGACNTVFRFDMPERKRKRRKVKQPPRLTVLDPPGELVMQYRRIFNEEERGWALGNGFFALIVLPLLLILLLIFAPVFAGLIGVWMAISWYIQAALMINQTTIRLDDARLAIMQKPLPIFSGARNFTLSSADIVEVFCDETEESRQSAGVNRFYHVRARLTNGDVIMLLKALPGEVALFIAQELNAGPDNFDTDDSAGDNVSESASDNDADTIDLVEAAIRASAEAAQARSIR